MLYNKAIKFLYPLISSFPLFLIMNNLLKNQIYNPVILLILPLPLVILTILLSSSYIKENLSEFEIEDRVLSGFFLVTYIIASIIISLLMVEMKLLMFVISIPMIVLGILTYMVSGIDIVKKYCEHSKSGLFNKHLKDTSNLVLGISSFKTLMLIIIKISELDLTVSVLVLFILSFVADITFIYLIRSRLYILNSKTTYNRSLRSSFFTISLIILLSLIISQGDSLLPYNKIVDFINGLSAKGHGFEVDIVGTEVEDDRPFRELLKSFEENREEYEINPVLALLWKALEFAVFVVGSVLIFIVFVIPFIAPFISKLKKGVKFSFKEYILEVLGFFKLLFNKPKEIVTNIVKSSSRVNKKKSSKKSVYKPKKLPKGILKYYYKLIHLLEKREHRKFLHGLTINDLLEKYKGDNRLKELFYREFYSGNSLEKNERSEIKKITKTLLKGR